MAISLKESIVILSEGAADKAFIEKLMAQRGNFPAVDFPYPNRQFSGNTSFGNMLSSLRGDPTGFARLRGILIIADSAGDPDKTFKGICSQIAGAGGYGVPKRLLELASYSGAGPAVAVTLIPDDSNPGSLESLFVKDIADRHDWIDECVETFLGCGKSKALNWSPEKLSKAKFHSMVASIHEDDPSRAASKVFRDPPVIDISAKCFDDLEKRIRDFCAAV
jgi:hypothetical protein